MECHADLQDALIKLPDRALLGPPQPLEALVAFNELTSVELLKSLQQQAGLACCQT
jgi:hypothetical protein